MGSTLLGFLVRYLLLLHFLGRSKSARTSVPSRSAGTHFPAIVPVSPLQQKSEEYKIVSRTPHPSLGLQPSSILPGLSRPRKVRVSVKRIDEGIHCLARGPSLLLIINLLRNSSRM